MSKEKTIYVIKHISQGELLWTCIADGLAGDRQTNCIAHLYAHELERYKLVERTQIFERSVKLYNLFAGVPEEQIDKLVAKTNTVEGEPVYNLLFSLLTSDLADVPLAMLIDAIQNTREYQKQLETFRTWQELCDKLTLVSSVLNNPHVCAMMIGRTSSKGREVFDALRMDLNGFFKVKENDLAFVE